MNQGAIIPGLGPSEFCRAFVRFSSFGGIDPPITLLSRDKDFNIYVRRTSSAGIDPPSSPRRKPPNCVQRPSPMKCALPATGIIVDIKEKYFNKIYFDIERDLFVARELNVASALFNRSLDEMGWHHCLLVRRHIK